MKRNYRGYKHPHPKLPPVKRIEGDFLRFLPISYYENDEFWEVDLPWLLSLKLFEKDFIIDEAAINYNLTLTDSRNIQYTLELNRIELKRAFGLTRSYTRGVATGRIYRVSAGEDEDYGVRVDIFGKHAEKDYKQKLKVIVNSVNFYYEELSNRLTKCIDWTDELEKILKTENVEEQK